MTLLLTPIVILVIASNVGSALAPTLVNDHPLLLILLDARNRHLVLVANQLDAVSYYTVGFFRLVLSDPLFFLLGFWYGEAALTWMDRKAGSFGRFLRSMEQFFGVAAYPLVFLAPNNFVCLFAGAARMNPFVFIALNASGTLARLYAIRVLGEVFESPIDSVLDFIREYRWPLTALTVAIVVVQLVVERRRGTSEIEGIDELEHELGGEIDRVGTAPHDPGHHGEPGRDTTTPDDQ
jgi:membrane protein DedA with SNARE-associated domain